MLREWLAELLGGQRWPELRTAMHGAATDKTPEPWDRAVLCYPQASRERRPRAMSS